MSMTLLLLLLLLLLTMMMMMTMTAMMTLKEVWLDTAELGIFRMIVGKSFIFWTLTWLLYAWLYILLQKLYHWLLLVLLLILNVVLLTEMSVCSHYKTVFLNNMLSKCYLLRTVYLWFSVYNHLFTCAVDSECMAVECLMKLVSFCARNVSVLHNAVWNYCSVRSVLGVGRRSRTSEQKITSGRSPLYLITFITLLM